MSYLCHMTSLLVFAVNSNLVTRSSPVPLCTPCQFLTTEFAVNSNLVTRSSPVPLCTPCQFLTTEYYPLLQVNNFELLTLLTVKFDFE
jgi:hypothetical protein